MFLRAFEKSLNPLKLLNDVSEQPFYLFSRCQKHEGKNLRKMWKKSRIFRYVTAIIKGLMPTKHEIKKHTLTEIGSEMKINLTKTGDFKHRKEKVVPTLKNLMSAKAGSKFSTTCLRFSLKQTFFFPFFLYLSPAFYQHGKNPAVWKEHFNRKISLFRDYFACTKVHFERNNFKLELSHIKTLLFCHSMESASNLWWIKYMEHFPSSHFTSLQYMVKSTTYLELFLLASVIYQNVLLVPWVSMRREKRRWSSYAPTKQLKV